MEDVKRKEMTSREIFLAVETVRPATAPVMPITPTRSGRTLGDLARLLVGEVSYIEQVATFLVFNTIVAELLWTLNLYSLRRERAASKTNQSSPIVGADLVHR